MSVTVKISERLTGGCKCYSVTDRLAPALLLMVCQRPVARRAAVCAIQVCRALTLNALAKHDMCTIVVRHFGASILCMYSSFAIHLAKTLNLKLLAS